MNTEIITMVVTSITTYFFAEIAKKRNKDIKEMLPLINLVIGIIAGILIYVLKPNDNLIYSIIISIYGAMTAGGTYDVIKKVTEDEEIEGAGIQGKNEA